ncbi:MAG: hypothetical protein FJW30_17665 [Acidobacteria bacterium]|nr:hypothetical protein [Acidobacteriota bacterium]
MTRFSPKSFAQPDLLRTIQPGNLVRLLEPGRQFLEERGLVLPTGSDPVIDYEQLSEILIQPDEFMPSQLIEGLHVISQLGTEANFDQLCEIAQRNFIEVDAEATAIDLAACLWIEVPSMLVVKEREIGANRRRRFESFCAREPSDVRRPEELPRNFTELEEDLEGWFLSKKRGIGCRVLRKDGPGEVRFLVQHGQLCKREPSRRGRESTITFFRPEKTDLVIYDCVYNELKLNASTVGEVRLYLELFGKHIFGDRNRFVYRQKYTLKPLQQLGRAALRCRDVGGMDWVRLTEANETWEDSPNAGLRWKAPDVFDILERRGRQFDPDSCLSVARFSVKVTWATSPRPLLVMPPNIAEYGRGEEAAVIEQWLRAREYVLGGEDEDTQSFLAGHRGHSRAGGHSGTLEGLLWTRP